MLSQSSRRPSCSTPATASTSNLARIRRPARPSTSSPEGNSFTDSLEGSIGGREIGKDYDLKDIDGVVLMGGEGTISEFVDGLVTRADGLRPPVGFIPLGSGNALVADFLQNQLRHGHETSVYSELKTVADWALERVCGGESCCIDLLEVTTRERRLVAATVCFTGLVRRQTSSRSRSVGSASLGYRARRCGA